MELLINKTNIPFITSDEPVIITKNGKLVEHGLLREDTDIFLPISVEFMIHLYKIDENINEIIRKYPHKDEHVLFDLEIKDFEKNNDGFLNEPLEQRVINDEKVIMNFNSYQFENSEINVYSNEEKFLNNYL